MANGILIGIDLGTTALKMCAFDARTGKALAIAAASLEVRSFPDGGREQNLSMLNRSFLSCAAHLRGQLGHAWKKVNGIGVAAQAGSTIVFDRGSDKPVTPMILWNDGRSHVQLSQLASRKDIRFWRKHTLCDVPPAGLGRLLWLKETRPELFAGERLHIGAGEYLFYRLTGVWRQDAGNALQVGSYNAAEKRLTSKLFDSIGIPLSMVAPLRQGSGIFPLSQSGARMLRLSKDTPAAGPYFDQESGYLSASGSSESPLQCSLGTAWVGNFFAARWDNRPVSLPIGRSLPHGLRKTRRPTASNRQRYMELGRWIVSFIQTAPPHLRPRLARSRNN